MPSAGRQPERRLENKLRQRMWGAAVLIAIAVIGLPLLLDGAGTQSQFRRVERLQEEPASTSNDDLVTRTSTPVAEMRAVGSQSTSGETVERVLSGAVSGSSQDATTSDATVERKTRQVLRQSQQPLTAWVVLAATFSDEDTALHLRDRLRSAGFASFVRDRESESDPFRVLVGPMIKESTAQKALAQVTSLLNRDLPEINTDPEIRVYP